MAKMNKKQRTQVIILAILSVALVLVIYWQYMLSPLIKECEELSSDIEENEMQLMQTMLEIADISTDIEENEALLKSIAEQTEKLYPIISTDDADIILLKYITASGLSANSLSVAQSEASSAGTGIYVITAEYSVSGSYKQLRNLIEKLNTEPAIYITSVSAVSETESSEKLELSAAGGTTTTLKTPASEEDMSITLSISLYMYEAPVIPDYFKPDKKDDLGDDEVISPEALL